MKTLCFSVFDVKTDTFGTPFFMPTKGAAIRAFSDLANDSNTTVGRHPEDYKLVQIGSFDDADGSLSEVEAVSLGFATDYRKA